MRYTSDLVTSAGNRSSTCERVPIIPTLEAASKLPRIYCRPLESSPWTQRGLDLRTHRFLMQPQESLAGQRKRVDWLRLYVASSAVASSVHLLARFVGLRAMSQPERFPKRSICSTAQVPRVRLRVRPFRRFCWLPEAATAPINVPDGYDEVKNQGKDN